MASYVYDFAGRRVSKTVYGDPDVLTKYLYDGYHVIAEYDGSDTLLRRFIYGPWIDEPIYMIKYGDGFGMFTYHQDGLGSVAALSDDSGNIVERYSYDVFGEPTIRDAGGEILEISDYNNPYMFTGRRLDDETGLYYYRFRHYDPNTGRFLQPDPIGYAAGLNMYAYVGNNPINFLDPFGLHPIRNALGEQVMHRHESGHDMDPRNTSPYRIGIDTQPAPYGEIIFEEAAKAFGNFALGQIPYVGSFIEHRNVIIGIWIETHKESDYYKDYVPPPPKIPDFLTVPIPSDPADINLNFSKKGS